ncbi:hypothetical protein ONZ45_g15676 [Pleurotus djamor]|nr:hypothetical protein ONZ45_g15676 [Pleurotus djamor]
MSRNSGVQFLVDHGSTLRFIIIGDPSLDLQCFDVRFLTGEEKLELAESILAAADVEDSTASISRVEEVEEAPEEEKEEDFVPRDE